MKMKKNVVKQILSLMMAVIVLVSGVSIPAKANEVIPDEEIVVGGDLKEDALDAGQEEVTDTTQELLTDTPTVYFENISGEKIPVTEGGTIELSALDEGRFVIEGIGEKSVEWDFMSKITDHEDQIRNQWWVAAYTGQWQPFILMAQPISGSVYNSDNPSEVFMNFSIKTVPSKIDAIKVYHGEDEVTVDNPYRAKGNEAFKVSVKGHQSDTDTWIDIPWQALECISVDGHGRFTPNNTFELWQETSQFSIILEETRGNEQPVKADFKATSEKIEIQDFNVSVPKTWFIDQWHDAMGTGGSYVGIMPGQDKSKDIVCEFTPENTLDTKLKWEALTPEIAEYTDTLFAGIIPKKSGVAKFKVTSVSNPALSKEVQVEFKYKNPLKSAVAETAEFKLEKDETLSFKIDAQPSNATEQRFHWTYDTEGVVEVTDGIKLDNSVLVPTEFTHSIRALESGTVKVTGTPYDETAGCKPVTFTVTVTESGVAQGDGDFLAMAKADTAHGVEYLKTQKMAGYNDEWNVFTVLRSGGKIEQSVLDSYYANVVNKLEKGTDKLRATDIARVSITLAAMGKDLADIEGINLMEAIYTDALSTKIGNDTTNAPIWALIALDCQNVEIPEDAVWTREKLIEQIIKFQTEDGGIALFGNSADLDITAMAVQAMAPYQNSNPQAKAAVDRAIAYMKNKMSDKAGFVGWGSENSCSTAQVVTALTAAGIDPTSAEFTVNENNPLINLDSYKTKNGFLYTLPSGAGAGAMATQQVTYAFESYRRFAENENRLYDLTDMLGDGNADELQAVFSIERFTLGQGYFVEPIVVNFKEGDNVTAIIKNVIGEENFQGMDSYLEAIKGADLGADKVIIPEYITKELGGPSTEEAKENGNDDEWLGEFDYSFMSGWMYCVNNEFPGVGISAYEPKDGDVIRLQFTYWGYGSDLGSSMMGGSAVKASNKDEITRLMARANADEGLKEKPAVKAAYAKAVELTSKVITPQEEIDKTSKELKEVLDNGGNYVAVTEVEKLIEAIGEVSLESIGKIEAAEKAYEALTEAQKALVRNIATLEVARAAYDKLKEEADKEAADKAAAAGVTKQIEAIGEVTLNKEAAVQAARAAYDGLTEAQKKYVSEASMKLLTDAESKIEELKAAADKEAAEKVEKLIEAIGEVSLESIGKIEAAEKAYEALTEAQKALVGNVATLESARAAYDKLKEAEDSKNEGGKTITNSKYKVSVSGEEITSDMVLEITPLTKDDADVKAMQKAVSSKYVITKLYHMAVYKDGKEVTLNKDVNISWAMDEKYNEKTVTVLHVMNGTVEKLSGKVKDGVLTVSAKALGNFGVVLEAKDVSGSGNNGTNGGSSGSGLGNGTVSGLDGVKTGDEAPIILMWTALLCAAALGTAVAVQKKRRGH